jgi:hypothetical protein
MQFVDARDPGDIEAGADVPATDRLDGHDVAIHVFKTGQEQCQIGTAVVPHGGQRAKWGF